MVWKVAYDMSDLSKLLDCVESEGPQRLQRGNTRFVLLLEDETREEENQLVRAFLDEPEFVDINIDRIDAPMRDPEL